VVSEFENAAYSREGIHIDKRVPFYLYADEFQNYVTDSFSSSLSEVRKYGLGLTLGHQYTAQVPEEMLSAILGNVGSLIAFRVGEEDAPMLAKQFAPFPPTRLLELGKYEVAARLLRDGQTSDAIAATTLPPLEQHAAPIGRSAGSIRQGRPEQSHAALTGEHSILPCRSGRVRRQCQ
jgi:TraM recognition site of TraD and TraG